MVPSLKICIHIGIRMNIKAPLCKKTDKNLEYIKKGYYICDVLTDTISIRSVSYQETEYPSEYLKAFILLLCLYFILPYITTSFA